MRRQKDRESSGGEKNIEEKKEHVEAREKRNAKTAGKIGRAHV